MPENAHWPLAPAQLTVSLAGLVHGPYTDRDTADTAGLMAEAVRYLNYAAPRGGITEPATVATITADLATAAYRLPQLLTALGDWLKAETSAGRIGDDYHRPAAHLTALIRAAISQATDHADNLAAALNTTHNLAATLHATGPAAPAA
jgi:hypothetical protein